MFFGLLKARARAVLQPGSRGGTGYVTGGGGWRYGQRATPAPSGTPATPPVDQVREVAQRLWGTDVDAVEQDGRCRVVRRTDAGGAVVLGDGASWPEALAAAKAAHQRPEDAPAVALAKAATKGPLLRFAKPPEAEGAHQLGTTARGKPVHASGAETAGYNDDDHLEAAGLHHRTAEHHAARADAHREASTADDDWRRAEIHHQEHERHSRLADHHHELARDHLVAGGRGGSQALTLGKDGRLAAGDVTPDDATARKAAKERCAARTHWGHPGGITPRDRHAYAGFGGEAPRRMAKGGGMLIFRMARTVRGLLLKGGEGSRGGHVIGHTKGGHPIYAGTGLGGLEGHGNKVGAALGKQLGARYKRMHPSEHVRESRNHADMADDRARRGDHDAALHQAALSDWHGQQARQKSQGNFGGDHQPMLWDDETIRERAAMHRRADDAKPAGTGLPPEIGRTTSGKRVHLTRDRERLAAGGTGEHGAHSWKALHAFFSPDDHREAAELHHRAAAVSDDRDAVIQHRKHADAHYNAAADAHDRIAQDSRARAGESPLSRQVQRHHEAAAARARAAIQAPQVGMFKALVALAMRKAKGGGEGSRGGHIVGHTSSGKPIYRPRMGETRKRDWNAMTRGYTRQDHEEAHKLHLDARRADRDGRGLDHGMAASLHGEAIRSMGGTPTGIVDHELEARKRERAGSGGHVVGHTKSGKPIHYRQDSGGLARTVSAVAADHADFSHADHKEASEFHQRALGFPSNTPAEAAAHADHMVAHDAAAKEKDPNGSAARLRAASDRFAEGRSRLRSTPEAMHGKPDPDRDQRSIATLGPDDQDHLEAVARHHEKHGEIPKFAEPWVHDAIKRDPNGYEGLRRIHRRAGDSGGDDKPWGYHNGDKVQFTGATHERHGGTFHEFEYLEGHRKGQRAVTQHGPGSAMNPWPRTERPTVDETPKKKPAPASTQMSLFKALVRHALRRAA